MVGPVSGQRDAGRVVAPAARSTDVVIPFNRPYITGGELGYMAAALASGRTSGDGPFTERCSDLLERIIGAPRVLLTTSGTHALELAALLIDVMPGDEVIVPAFTFPSTANAFVLRGAIPTFADIDPHTLNMDPASAEGLVSERTKAIVPVHYAGVGCAMPAILDFARRRGLRVVEDNAHGLFGAIGVSPLGTFGDLAALSFHETKNVSCGEGGALVLNDRSLIDRAEVIREKGTDRSRFFRGEVDRYTWVDLGSSFVPSDLLAAFLLAQLEAREEIQAKRKALWDRYYSALHAWATDNGMRLPYVPEGYVQPYHMFYVLTPTSEERSGLLARLRSHGILAVFHYQPLHVSEMGRSYGGIPGACPVSEDVAARLVRLPFYTSMTSAEQDRVIEVILTSR